MNKDPPACMSCSSGYGLCALFGKCLWSIGCYKVEKYWQKQKVLALVKLCEDEQLDKEQFKAFIDAYIFSGQEPLRDEGLKCVDNRPCILQACEMGERIINRMKEYIEVFDIGMVA